MSILPKSRVLFYKNTPPSFIGSVSNILNIKVIDNLGSYLGTTLSNHRLQNKELTFLIDRFPRELIFGLTSSSLKQVGVPLLGALSQPFLCTSCRLISFSIALLIRLILLIKASFGVFQLVSLNFI